jgi:hypothetical protein
MAWFKSKLVKEGSVFNYKIRNGVFEVNDNEQIMSLRKEPAFEEISAELGEKLFSVSPPSAKSSDKAQASTDKDQDDKDGKDEEDGKEEEKDAKKRTKKPSVKKKKKKKEK